MEYELNSDKKTKSTTTYLHVGDDPQQGEEEGYVKNTGIREKLPICFEFLI